MNMSMLVRGKPDATLPGSMRLQTFLCSTQCIFW